MWTKIALVAAGIGAAAGLYGLSAHLVHRRAAALAAAGLTTTVADVLRSPPHGIIALQFTQGFELWAVEEGHEVLPRKGLVIGGKLIVRADGQRASEADVESLGLPIVRRSYKF